MLGGERVRTPQQPPSYRPRGRCSAMRPLVGRRALLDPWHLWVKVKARAREVLGHRKRALGAAPGVYERLKRGAVEEARELVELCPAANEGARERRERLLAYLERNRDSLGDYEALRQSGSMIRKRADGESQRLGRGAPDEEREDALEPEGSQRRGLAPSARAHRSSCAAPTNLTCFAWRAGCARWHQPYDYRASSRGGQLARRTRSEQSIPRR